MIAPLPLRQRGLSLIELMIAMVIGLIAILVVTQFAISFQAQKRTTVGTAESMDEGAVALYTLRREIMGAGYGIIDTDLTACRIQAHDARPDTPATARDFNFSIYPVLINQGGGGAPDTITVNYSSSPMLASATMLIQDFAGDETTNLKLTSRYGFNPGDVVVIADSPKHANIDPAIAPRDCSMYQVTRLPTDADSVDTIEHRNTTYTNVVGSTVPSRFNKAGGLGITVGGVVQAGAKFEANKAKVFNLGPNPISNAYTVQNNRLEFTEGLSGTTTVLLDNVVTFQAQFGLDTRGGTQADLQVTGYSDAMIDADGNGEVGNSGDWLRVGAVRFAIVMRNRQPEINPDGSCSATSTPPSWSWGSATAAAMSADWQCYKYKVFETVVPLRNMMWRPS
ncbi:MAG: PilW family protein [Betaproteobacteria bacterium]|nr:PilW family protein [Betaproteobacteria bacterium]